MKGNVLQIFVNKRFCFHKNFESLLPKWIFIQKHSNDDEESFIGIEILKTASKSFGCQINKKNQN